MYHPYFRGKQYELITVRETAPILATSGFVPIIEPVKETLGGLQRTLQAVCDENGRAIVIVNPHHGDHAEDGIGITELLQSVFSDCPQMSAGILLKQNMSVADVLGCCQEHAAHDVTLVHRDFADGKSLADALGDQVTTMKHVFFESCGILYRKHFKGAERVLLRDGFVRRRNRDYPPVEPFSDLHITYEEQGGSGFGDFLTVGDDYSESGGPAYAVALHLTFVDPTKENAMFIYHFVSESQDTPTDPAGKFGEALELMMQKLNEPNNHIFPSDAVAEFREFYRRGHFPGLGYIKKLSMKHHIETLAHFFE
jgi:hypothetical protein